MKIPTHKKINGYYRVYLLRIGCDGDKIYNTEWRSGITNEHLGGVRKKFDKYLTECAHKNSAKRHEAKVKAIGGWPKWAEIEAAIIKSHRTIEKYNRDEAATQKREEKENRKRSRKAKFKAMERMRAAKKYSGSFFQMQAASKSISEYATTTN